VTHREPDWQEDVMTLVTAFYRGVGARNELFELTQSGDYRIEGGGGDDVIRALAGGSHTLFGDAGSDLVESDVGNDTLFGDTTATGAGGNDMIVAYDGADLAFGGGGNDQIDGGLGADGIDGGDGNDTIWGGQGADAIVGGSGDDLIFGNGNPAEFLRKEITYTHLGTTDAAQTATFARLILASADDLASDWINGEAGNDTIFGQGGSDTLLGGTGDDAIAGGADADFISGNEGADILFGESGGDLITGGFGGDIIRGGLGGDLIAFNVGDNGDLIQAFNEGGVRDGFDLRGYFDATGFAGNNPRAAGIMQVLQSGADTDVYLHGAFAFRIEGVVAAAIDDTYFLFQ
jgi:Ca2+-binding RTX toxin-like protein